MPDQKHDTRAEQRRASAANGSGAGLVRDRQRVADDVVQMPEVPTVPDVRPARNDRRHSPLIVIDPEDPNDPARTTQLILPSDPSDIASVERSERALDLVSLGECLVEMSRRPDGAYQPSIAGDAFNTLFYASRLGLRSGLITSVGDDLFTPMIIERIVDERIDLTHVQRLEGRRNGIYFIEHDAWGERQFHYWRENSAATETLLHAHLQLNAYVATTHFLLLTGVSLAVLKNSENVFEMLRRAHGRTSIVFDANYRPRLWKSAQDYRFQLEVTLPFVDVFLPSRQDLESAYDDRDVIDVLRMAADAGVSTIVMKDGANGCAMFIDGELVHVPPAERPHVVDTTGAGDAFNAGMIAGLLRGSTLLESCELAQRVAARTLIVPGAIDPSFTPHAIDASWRVG